jgi:hypothetical protein
LFLFDSEEKDGGGMRRFLCACLAACAFSLSLSLFSSYKSKVKSLAIHFLDFPQKFSFFFFFLPSHIFSAKSSPRFAPHRSPGQRRRVRQLRSEAALSRREQDGQRQQQQQQKWNGF